MLLSIPPQWLLLLSAGLFLLGCVIGAVRPNRWKLALAAIVPASLLTVWLVFGEDLSAFFAPLLSGALPADAAAPTPR